jgi:imidazolonepropionase-like amidohydrolase
MNMQHKRDANDYYITTLRDSTGFRAIQGVANARSMLEYGFTTVRDIGNAANYADTDLRRAIEQEIVPGPTIINAGRIIAPYGGQFQMQPDKPRSRQSRIFLRRHARRIEKSHPRKYSLRRAVIKIVVDDQRYIYSVDDIKFVIEEARLAGLKVAAHAGRKKERETRRKPELIQSNTALINDETLAIAKSKNIALVPTPFTETDAREGGNPGGNKEVDKIWFADPVKRANKIGVTLVFGPDVIFSTKEYPRGRLSIETIDNWKEAGIPSSVILQSLTTNAANLLGVEKTRGYLKSGMRADIIAVGDNPLDKIDTLKRFAL